MPDAPTAPAETATTTTSEGDAAAATPGSNERAIDSFPPEAQDYIRRLRQENAAKRNELKTVSGELKTYQDKDKTEQQKLADRIQEAESAAATAAATALRYEVAAEKGLPLSLAARLQGGNKDELSADADKLKAEFRIEGGNAGGPAGGPSFDGGARRSVNRPKSMNDLVRQATGRA